MMLLDNIFLVKTIRHTNTMYGVYAEEKKINRSLAVEVLQSTLLSYFNVEYKYVLCVKVNLFSGEKKTKKT